MSDVDAGRQRDWPRSNAVAAKYATRFGGADAARLEGAMRTLVAPLRFATLDAWRRAVVSDLKALFGADQVTVLLPVHGRASFFNEDAMSGAHAAYPGAIAPLDQRWSIWARQGRLGVWDRETLWYPWYAEFRRSAYYHDFVVPNRFFDAIGLTCHAGPPGARLTADTAGGVWLHHDRETGRAFGPRGLALLRLLYPTFTAGVDVLRRLDAYRASLVRTVDAVGQPLLLAGDGGRVLHRTPALAELLAVDPDRTVVIGAMADLAGSLALLVATRGEGASRPASVAAAHRTAPVPATVREVVTRTARYRLRACEVTPDLADAGCTVLVAAERSAVRAGSHDPASPRRAPSGAAGGRETPEDSAPGGPSLDELSDRFGLTSAQARVARLVCGGHSVMSVAAALGISPHTVRRHEDQLRARLGVRSRAAIVATLLQQMLP